MFGFLWDGVQGKSFKSIALLYTFAFAFLVPAVILLAWYSSISTAIVTIPVLVCGVVILAWIVRDSRRPLNLASQLDTMISKDVLATMLAHSLNIDAKSKAFVSAFESSPREIQRCLQVHFFLRILEGSAHKTVSSQQRVVLERDAIETSLGISKKEAIILREQVKVFLSGLGGLPRS